MREERLKEETRRKEENSQRKDDKTPQSQELRDLANTEDKYIRLAKSGYYDEKKAERAEAKKQTKEAPAQGGFAARREALKPKVQEALKKQDEEMNVEYEVASNNTLFFDRYIGSRRHAPRVPKCDPETGEVIEKKES